MSRTRTIPPIPDHIDPEKAKARKEVGTFRQAEKAEAIARVLGTKKEEDEE
jgi:hypothetical protein